MKTISKQKVGLLRFISTFLFFCIGYFLLVLVLYAIPYFGWEIAFGEEMPPISDFVEYSLWLFVIGASIITLRKKFSLRSGNYFSIKQYLPHFDFSGNRSFVILLVAMGIVIFYLWSKTSGISQQSIKGEGQPEAVNCQRKEKYENLPEFDRALSLYNQRITEKLGFSTAETLINCVVVQYTDARNEGAEGYFIFNNEEASADYLPIYVDQNYKEADDLLTAVLLAHEVTHARQFLHVLNGQNNVSCMDKEIDAFMAQTAFIMTLNEGELNSLSSRLNDEDKHPQLAMVDDLMYVRLSPAIENCGQGNTECIFKKLRENIRIMVYTSPFYQKQCGDYSGSNLPMPTYTSRRTTKILITLPYPRQQLYCDENMAIYITNLSLFMQSRYESYKELIATIREQNRNCFNVCYLRPFSGCGELCAQQSKDKMSYLDQIEQDIDEKRTLLKEAVSKHCVQ